MSNLEKAISNPAASTAGFFTQSFQGTGYTLNLFAQSLYWSRALPRKWSEMMGQAYLFTFGSMPVVFIVATFTGMILALQTGIELRRYGQEGSIGLIVAASMCREMGPVMTAFALTGLIGSTIAAEIGTMKVSEEIDALEVMSINPVYYLVMPRMLALALVAPLLTIYTDVIGILGGGVVGYSIFDTHFHTYMDKVRTALEVRDIYSGLLKALVFGITIVIVSCSQGLRAENGAEGVGRATLRAVVISFIFILMFDFFITRAIY